MPPTDPRARQRETLCNKPFRDGSVEKPCARTLGHRGGCNPYIDEPLIPPQPFDKRRKAHGVEVSIEEVEARLAGLRGDQPSVPPSTEGAPTGFDPECETCCDPVEWCHKHLGEPHEGSKTPRNVVEVAVGYCNLDNELHPKTCGCVEWRRLETRLWPAYLAPPSPVSEEAPRGYWADVEGQPGLRTFIERPALSPSEGATPEDDDLLIRTPGPSQSVQGRMGEQCERAPLTFDDDCAPAPTAGEPLTCECGHSFGLHRPGKDGAIVCYGIASDEEGEFVCDCKPSVWVAALSAERAAHAATTEKYELLRRAVNDSPEECGPDCDRHGHGEVCPRIDPAIWLERQQAALESLRAARLQAEQERDRAQEDADRWRFIYPHLSVEPVRNLDGRVELCLDDLLAFQPSASCKSIEEFVDANARAALRAPTEAP